MITVVKQEQNNDNARLKADSIIDQCKVETKKLALIHASPPKPVAMAPLTGDKKLTILRNVVPKDEIMVKEIKIEPTSPKKPEVYQMRKSMLLEYKELFTALMRLSDRELQKKLLDVINNHRKTDFRTVETQTDYVESGAVQHEASSISNCEDESSTSNDKCGAVNEEIESKRKRKRKISVPQVNKESRAKQLAKMNQPKTKNENNRTTTAYKDVFKLNLPKRQRNNSYCFSECSSDVVNIYEDTETNHLREIDQCCLPLENGLLPIQDAVVRNQINKLYTHILLLHTYKRIDLNDILTEEDEDLLQLAVLNTCDPTIVSLLLKKGLNPNSLDADSNTVVHLAILNDITVASLDQLLKHIDLKLLLTLNDDGYTPLHLAVRQDRYLLAERLINVLDERLVKKVFFRRPVDELETDEIILKKQFKDYYEKICLQMTAEDETDVYTLNNHDLKQKLLQLGDRRSGNTGLYFAIYNRFDHLIYFLLAHLTDPRTENLSGLDCKTYFSEFGKSLSLSLNIDNTMEKVIKLLS